MVSFSLSTRKLPANDGSGETNPALLEAKRPLRRRLLTKNDDIQSCCCRVLWLHTTAPRAESK